MRIKIAVKIYQEFEGEIPDYVKRDKDSIEEYLLDHYDGFDDEEEGEMSFDFTQVAILK